jgi:hypothetical protein
LHVVSLCIYMGIVTALNIAPAPTKCAGGSQQRRRGAPATPWGIQAAPVGDLSRLQQEIMGDSGRLGHYL